MIERIKEVLSRAKGISGWKVVETRTISEEFFFVKRELDMNRAKKVQHYRVTVYKDFEESGKRFRGSSTTNIHPTMKEVELERVIGNAVYAAGFVKNEYYPLVKPQGEGAELRTVLENEFSKRPMAEWLPLLVQAVYAPDVNEKGWINSSEFFLNKVYTRIINSEGIDVSFERYLGELEYITNWREAEEEIELYKHISFADYKPDMVSQNVHDTLLMAKERAVARPTPALGKFTVLLTGEPVKEFFNYYYYQANVHGVYNHTSTAKVGEKIQGDSVRGDKVSITLNPFLQGSTYSAPYDGDGLKLQSVKIYDNGYLSRYWGDMRHSHYLQVEPTGVISNMIVEGGSKSQAEFKKDPYLELVTFSDFQMNDITGDFAGEIRLGWYYDGDSVTPVTGGSISGNIRELQKEMYFSSEQQQQNNFVGPKTIELFNVSVAGCE